MPQWIPKNFEDKALRNTTILIVLKEKKEKKKKGWEWSRMGQILGLRWPYNVPTVRNIPPRGNLSDFYRGMTGGGIGSQKEQTWGTPTPQKHQMWMLTYN